MSQNEIINPDVEGLYELCSLPENKRAWFVKIIQGPWSGIAYTYGKIDFQKLKGKINVKIVHDILFVPIEKRRELSEDEYKEWEILVGKIAVNIIQKHADKLELSGDKLFLSKLNDGK